MGVAEKRVTRSWRCPGYLQLPYWCWDECHCCYRTQRRTLPTLSLWLPSPWHHSGRSSTASNLHVSVQGRDSSDNLPSVGLIAAKTREEFHTSTRSRFGRGAGRFFRNPSRLLTRSSQG